MVAGTRRLVGASCVCYHQQPARDFSRGMPAPRPLLSSCCCFSVGRHNLRHQCWRCVASQQRRRTAAGMVAAARADTGGELASSRQKMFLSAVDRGAHHYDRRRRPAACACRCAACSGARGRHCSSGLCPPLAARQHAARGSVVAAAHQRAAASTYVSLHDALAPRRLPPCIWPPAGLARCCLEFSGEFLRRIRPHIFSLDWRQDILRHHGRVEETPLRPARHRRLALSGAERV